MQQAWAQAFPPLQPGALLGWLVQAHTGVMLGYPIREAAPALFLLCLLGAWDWLRARRWDLLVLCGCPFAFTFLAALLRRYPYGDHPRLAQHLAPAIFLLAGTGTGRLIITLTRSSTAQRRWSLGVLGLLAIIGIGGIGFDLTKRYKNEADFQARAMVRDLLTRSEETDALVVCCAFQDLRPSLEWYLRRTGRIRCLGLHDERPMPTSARNLWYLALQSCTAAPAVQSAVLRRTGHTWTLCEHQAYRETPDETGVAGNHYEVFHWLGSPIQAAPDPD
jgi:hypothetical protein